MGRPIKYRNVAEKQKAYRERKNQVENDSQCALVALELVKQREVTLRNIIAYWIGKGRKPEIYRSKSGDYAQVLVDGYNRNGIQTIVIDYLVQIGALVEARKDWAGTFYTLK